MTVGGDKVVEFSFGQGIQSQLGRWYDALQRIDRGGNAVTWIMMARTGPHAGMHFAVKTFFLVSKEERREAFLKEMRFLRDRDHPNIMRTYDDGVLETNHPFVVAEYLPQTLRQVIGSGVASIVEKTSYVTQLLSALKYLAALKEPIIHRDIKPANIFVKGGACVLGDFGLMKTVGTEDDDGFKHSIGRGMPYCYRTPDLVAYLNGDGAPTVASDVYQLGLVVAELFTGKNPQICVSHQRYTDPVQCRALDRIRGSRGKMIQAVIQSMLEPDPARRPTAESLFDQWHGIFLELARDQEALGGRVF